MWLKVAAGLFIPLLGTTLGAACVFFLKNEMSERLSRALAGFAGGIMVAASFFSLIVPALDQTKAMGKLAFLPVGIGFLAGMLFLLVLDLLVPHVHLDKSEEGPRTGLKRTTKLFLAVTLHNLPEGMVVGIVFAGWLYGKSEITLASALVLSIGIALQNFPEGAVVSMPLRAEGMPKGKTFLLGMLSGVIEPVGALMTAFAASLFLPIMPYLLAFAAGAMFYVVVEELVPEMAKGDHTNFGTVCFALGFILMMGLDIAFG
ncbi:MAG: ZIP family metal transporter [Clostridia bacterium]|nr:ZIP family metal transporter [Clostridia bacterium]MBQ2517486.1 ZIP family metal transporter [Clostridia bacterium]MBQ4341240.1 ZIP family metal transporter [Clostridia bacterium]MBR6428817.1 ZIP family metal transporter [Clostridia bacterium]